jgi:RHS repeat-associated protein
LIGLRIHTEGVLDVAYALDSVGNRTRKTVNGDSVDYTYDALNRLIGQSDGKPNQTQAYTYDRVGNRLTGPAKHDAYVYEAGNRLVSDQHAQYVYDAMGNLIEQHTGEGVVYFAYDAENRLSKVTMPDGKVVEYGYDPMGRRVRRTVDGASTYYVMADEDMIAEFEGDTMTVKYIHGPGTDEPWALVNRKGTYYYHADGLGSIVAITDGSRRTVQTYEYDFFGGQGGGASFGGLHDMKNRIKQPYAFTGREFDRDTRLYYYRARYYDPGTGRFTQQDPIGYQGGLNLYAYVDGNPVNAVDPWGLRPPDVIYTGTDIDWNIAQARIMGSQHAYYEFYYAVRTGGIWDYKKYGKQYEDFGNYHFGIVGAAFGYSLYTLQSGAGYYQILSGTSSWDFMSSYWDDSEDSYWIRQGFKDYQAGNICLN